MSLLFQFGWLLECPKCHSRETLSLTSILQYDDKGNPPGRVCKRCLSHVRLRWATHDEETLRRLRTELEKIEADGRQKILAALDRVGFELDPTVEP